MNVEGNRMSPTGVRSLTDVRLPDGSGTVE
jgi:hypothetical protein